MMLLRHRVAFLLLFLCCWTEGVTLRLAAAESAASQNAPVFAPVTNGTAAVESNAAPGFNVVAYTVEGNPLLSTNVLMPMFSKHTGTNVGLEEIVKAASDLQLEYRNQGYPAMSVAFAREQITNGIVTLNVFQTAVPQIVVSGVRYLNSTSNTEVASNPSAAKATSATNAVPSAISRPTALANPGETARAVHSTAVSTNTRPRFSVEEYLVMGNTILSPAIIGQVITNANGAFGTNVSFDGIGTVVTELGKAYRERGYVTVSVTVPQQKLTNETVKLQVTEGRLADIKVTGNRYFSSNNVMRALPSLNTDMFLNGPIFNAELNRANVSQDRTIYPVIGPGPDPGTSELTLKVKDQLPLHAKVEFNNQSSPGTPDLRINSSAVYNNLWQLEHSLGVQYGFSPEAYKQGNQWDLYDQPLVANYSTFYRLPLGSPGPIEDVVANNPSRFGYDEATRKFNLPPPSGRTELTLYASRATIDTGLENLLTQTLVDTNNYQAIKQEVQQGITINQTIGFQLSKPLPEINSFHSALSGGLDYKNYYQANYQTNIFIITTVSENGGGQLTTNVSQVPSPTPATLQKLDYLPLSLRYDAGWRDFLGTATFGLGLSANLWYSSLYSTTSTATSTSTNINGGVQTNTITTVTSIHGVQSLTNITGSTQSSGHWVILNPSFSRTFVFYTNWITSIRADGQWTSEPLISNEQFGAGGVNSVRGYHEGEVFGDTGWHVSLEQQTPPHVVGYVSGNVPLTIRGSIYTDYATVYLLDPQGRPGSTALWGTGFGCVASIGPHWEAQFLFSVPLLKTSTTRLYQPFFNFALTGQF
jgi:hemolysin activation/secretion protein